MKTPLLTASILTLTLSCAAYAADGSAPASDSSYVLSGPVIGVVYAQEFNQDPKCFISVDDSSAPKESRYYVLSKNLDVCGAASRAIDGNRKVNLAVAIDATDGDTVQSIEIKDGNVRWRVAANSAQPPVNSSQPSQPEGQAK